MRKRFISFALRTVDQAHELFDNALNFLEAFDVSKGGCLVLDIRLPRMIGLVLQEKLAEVGSSLPIIFVTGHGDIPMALERNFRIEKAWGKK